MVVAETINLEKGYDQIYSGEIIKKAFALTNNRQFGSNFQFARGTGNIFPKEYTPQDGDVIHVHFEGIMSNGIVRGKSDSGVNCAGWFALVDTSSPENKYWNILSEQVYYDDEIRKGEFFSFDFEIVVSKKSTTKARLGGAELVMGTCVNQTKAVKIKNTGSNFQIFRKK